ncbi:cytochrome P450 [Kibdelosporangium banguiense]|uniref:Cytochrome P450 n=1 Tax=Kibdelosporangium banguiense TaxID=1365924 RepID=A0ABS4U234_9PSEU|nr:cytochrome P450 [Kibdelosporangium banguiense]MBP2330722.1 cytochrome P450 [Kibdelosporangium banguiense]
MAANARKIDRGETEVACPVRHDDDGVWRITGYAAGRAFLRETATVQAGLGIETIEKMPARMRRPVLYRDGPEHREHRRQTARFFTARRVDQSYRDTMQRVAEAQLDRLRRDGSADLSELSFQLAVEVAAAVIGLTESRPGIKQRLERFFPDKFGTPGFTSLHGLYWVYRQVTNWARIYFNDVRPAVQARRKSPKDDLISHLIGEGCSAADILGECLTFAAAGMVTTREFIVLAAWHLFTDADLLAGYQAAQEPERLAILHELLRLEPVLGHIRRRTTEPVDIPGGFTVPQGAMVHVQIDTANLDTDVVGEQPLAVCPGREITTGLSFGDGAHKCPGAHVAMLETDIFLTKLFALDGITMQSPPTMSHKPDIDGYELRGMRVAVKS